MSIPHSLGVDIWLPGTGSWCGPLKVNSKYYGFLLDMGGGLVTDLCAVGTSDPSTTDFAIKDRTAQPRITTSADDDNGTIDCDPGSTVTIGVVTQHPSSEDPEFHEFNTSSDTWTTLNEVIDSAASENVAHMASICWRPSATEWFVLYQGYRDKVMGVNRPRVDYGRKSGASWISVGNRVDYGDNTSYDEQPYYVGYCVADSSGRVYMTFSSRTVETGSAPQIYLRVLNTSNVLNPTSYSVTSADGYDGQFYICAHRGVVYDDSGTEKIRFVFQGENGSAELKAYLLEMNEGDDPTVTSNEVGDNEWSSSGLIMGVAADGTDVYTLYFESVVGVDNDKIWYDLNDGTDVDMTPEADDGWNFSANIYDRGGTKIGFFAWGPVLKYYEEDISAVVGVAPRPPIVVGQARHRASFW
jgi:hypothetical protein